MTPEYDDHPNGKPDPACLLTMHKLVEQTAGATADKVADLIRPVVDRVDHMEYVIRGNGMPGVLDEVRMLKQAHQDARALRRQLGWFALAHVLTIAGAIVGGTLWVARVERHMDAVASMARVELAGRVPVVIETDRGQVVIRPPDLR
ncbi:MAG: hypothetical protein KBC05_14915 [Candidatus Hydrogenedentes bacterium]|nr:hypothetical protein [Candidatus Hydrogenedentota bacterium]